MWRSFILNEKHVLKSEIHLDAVRGLAALVVVLGHARGLFFQSLTGGVAAKSIGVGAVRLAQAGPAETLTLGHCAVMIFFVLSGYLVGGSVTRSMRDGRWSWGGYLINRLVRLWVVLVPALLLGIAIDHIGARLLGHAGSIYAAPPGQDYVRPDFLQRDSDPVVILGNLLFVQTFLVPVVGSNSALWSLANEFWYYILFPALMLAMRAGTAWPGRLAYAVMAAGIVALMGFHASYLFLPWLFGVAVAQLPSGAMDARLSPLFLPYAVAFPALVIVIRTLEMPLIMGEMMVSLAATLLIYLISRRNVVGRPSVYAMTSRYFSSISYTLYLSHLPILVLMSAVLNDPWSVRGLTLAYVARFALCIGVALIYASILYFLFERNTDKMKSLVRSALQLN